MKKLDKEQLEAVMDAFSRSSFKKTFKAFLKEKGLIKPELEAGKWYAYEECNLHWLMCYTGNGGGYGFNTNKIWGDDYMMSNENVWREATTQEVEDALIKEAKKRGFKEGVRFKSITESRTYEGDYTVNRVKWGYSKENYGHYLYSQYGYIFENGKWATIIEEKKEFTMQEIEDIVGCGVKIIK